MHTTQSRTSVLGYKVASAGVDQPLELYRDLVETLSAAGEARWEVGQVVTAANWVKGLPVCSGARALATARRAHAQPAARVVNNIAVQYTLIHIYTTMSIYTLI